MTAAGELLGTRGWPFLGQPALEKTLRQRVPLQPFATGVLLVKCMVKSAGGAIQEKAAGRGH